MHASDTAILFSYSEYKLERVQNLPARQGTHKLWHYEQYLSEIYLFMMYLALKFVINKFMMHLGAGV